MRHFAILTMLFSWLLYGAMPALGGCPMTASSLSLSMAEADAHADMHGMAGMTGSAMMPDAASHRHPAAPSGHGNVMHASFCPACLIVPPPLNFQDAKALVFAYPAPTAMQPLRDARAAPTPPPPRFV